MRHRHVGRQLSRSSSHRKALMQGLSNHLIIYEMIKTTLAKAKELRRFVEPLITASKQDSLAARRLVFNRLRDDVVVKKLFTDLKSRYEKRNGGYIRVLKYGYRSGDSAPMALVELVDRDIKQNISRTAVTEEKEGVDLKTAEPIVEEERSAKKAQAKSKKTKAKSIKKTLGPVDI